VGFLRLWLGEKFILSAGEGSPAEGASKTRNESCGFFAFMAGRDFILSATEGSHESFIFVFSFKFISSGK
jgi:hypothetical protein